MVTEINNLFRAKIDFCSVNVYKVIFENNVAVSALPANNLQHSDVGLKQDKETIQWLALECPDAQTAIEVGNKVVKMIWVYEAA